MKRRRLIVGLTAVVALNACRNSPEHAERDRLEKALGKKLPIDVGEIQVMEYLLSKSNKEVLARVAMCVDDYRLLIKRWELTHMDDLFDLPISVDNRWYPILISPTPRWWDLNRSIGNDLVYAGHWDERGNMFTSYQNGHLYCRAISDGPRQK